MTSNFDNLFDVVDIKESEIVKPKIKKPKKKSISEVNPPSSTSAVGSQEKGMSGGRKGVKEINLPEPASLSIEIKADIVYFIQKVEIQYQKCGMSKDMKKRHKKVMEFLFGGKL